MDELELWGAPAAEGPSALKPGEPPRGFTVQERGWGQYTIHHRRSGMGCMNTFVVVWWTFWTAGCVVLLINILTEGKAVNADPAPPWLLPVFWTPQLIATWFVVYVFFCRILSETWHKHVSSEPFDANLVDESIVYATCETAAAIAENDPSAFLRYLTGGPLSVELNVDEHLAAELRALHLRLSNEGEFLMISQFEDMDPEEGRRLKKEFGLDEHKFEPMFDVLGRWSMSADFLSNLLGLMSKREIVRTAWKLGVK